MTSSGFHITYLKYTLFPVLLVVHVIVTSLALPRYCRLNSGDRLEDEQFCLGATHTDSQDVCSFVAFQNHTWNFFLVFCVDVISLATGISLKAEWRK